MTSVERADLVVIVSFLMILAGVARELWKWRRRRIDGQVLNYMEEHARKHSGNRLQSLANITRRLGMSEEQVTEALTRLRKAGKVRQHGENWMLTEGLVVDLNRNP
jgi:predicted Rossmann fold nucleotide-binding protein DprA/Smf involved in DNA uptake